MYKMPYRLENIHLANVPLKTQSGCLSEKLLGGSAQPVPGHEIRGQKR